ncbi:MAG: hypothetical protein IJX42_03370, partial [Oscillospiraceae bacterium]|nr:hypothetical protein [Oscillospiraceae bacterium]
MSGTGILEKEDNLIEDTPVKESSCPPLDFQYIKKPVYDFVKRVGDIFCSLIAILILFLPLL